MIPTMTRRNSPNGGLGNSKFPSNLVLRKLSCVEQVDDFVDLLLGQTRVGIVFSRLLWGNAFAKLMRVLQMIAARPVFQIFKAVAGLVSILVADIRPWWSRPKKGGANQRVNRSTLSIEQVNKQVAPFVLSRREQKRQRFVQIAPCLGLVNASDLTKIRDFVKSLKADDGQPFFHRLILTHQAVEG